MEIKGLKRKQTNKKNKFYKLILPIFLTLIIGIISLEVITTKITVNRIANTQLNIFAEKEDADDESKGNDNKDDEDKPDADDESKGNNNKDDEDKPDADDESKGNDNKDDEDKPDADDKDKNKESNDKDGTVENEFLSSIDMLIDILENDEEISSYANTMKYIYYKYTNNESYKTNLDFSAYDTSDFSDVGSSTFSGSGFEQFKKWLHGWEGGSVTKDGKFYIVESDGSKTGSAVGHGVDIGTHGAKLRAAGYNTSIGSKIPVDVVDAIEEKEINGKIAAVKSRTKGLGLTDYQIYALVSRAYNCGVSGAFTTRNGLNFKQAYNNYWKKDRDDKYGKKEQVDYTHNLYSKYMYLPNTSGGEFLKGLENRRKSEWLLFQTGWFDDRGNVNAYCSTEDESANIDTKLKGEKKEKMQKLIARAIEIADDKDYKYYTYSKANRYGQHSFDCSSFCARLYKKYFNINIPNSTSSYGNEGYIGSVGSVELQPGDILWRSGHVELYIGNNKRAGAHDHYPSNPKNDISIKKGTSGFTKVYRFVK